ncbi:MAG: peptide-methionine (S)-S-oxide reductase MsrA [Candidatus Omnitrophica bacterium]|nr:peptide-methionine (S)-S-oxide reductase MsrA [Candidatus Omnitrophota bacterium]
MKRLILGLMVLTLTWHIGTPAGAQPERGVWVEKAIFAGGCFWCMQPPYDEIPGVLSTTVGYTGGDLPDPSYEQVCTGKTGHAEAVEIEYDSRQVSYADLLEVFWQNIDPTSLNSQFADYGTQYRTAVFYLSEEQREQAENSKAGMEQSGLFSGPIVTEIVPASEFYPAEEDHQKYYKKAPRAYEQYKTRSGRAGYLRKTWDK